MKRKYKLKGELRYDLQREKAFMFLGLPWTFTTYTVTDEFISIDSGLLNKVENDCYMYKVIDVRQETTLLWNESLVSFAFTASQVMLRILISNYST